MARRGTVTPLGSIFPPEEAYRASQRVQHAVAERRKELDRLRGFAADNAALAALVQRLPDELSHDIMVPFGGAAFFPGRLIHTNEFLVLLGEGYYAERTAKQTVEILQRRGKSLEAQMDSLKATMLDLEAEARFFDSTAAEAAEGLVDIREDYVEEPIQNKFGPGVQHSESLCSLKADNSKIIDEDEEYARIMARLDELEKEELEAGSGSENGENEDTTTDSAFSESQNQFDVYETGISQKHKAEDAVQQPRDRDFLSSTTSTPIGDVSQLHITDRPSFVDTSARSIGKAYPPLPPDPKEDFHRVQKLENSSGNIESLVPRMGSGVRKAFTGSIIEHSHGLPSNNPKKSSTSDQPSGSNPSKPVSRFKMQKGSRS